MTTDFNSNIPCIRVFPCSLIPDQIVLSIDIAPDSKFHITDLTDCTGIFQNRRIFSFLSVCICHADLWLQFAHIFVCTIYKLHNSIFCGYICMNIIRCVLTVIFRLYHRFISSISLSVRLIPYDITLVCLAPNWNIYCIDA